MSKDIWFPWYPADYASKASHLTMVEDGAYRRLLDHYYQMGGRVLANATRLLRVCRAFDAAEIAAVKAVLAEFFVVRDGHYRHERADIELEKRTKLREKRAAVGAKGGLAKARNLLKQKATQSQSHIREEDSVAIATGGKPPDPVAIASEQKTEPSPASAGPLDLQKELWSRGVLFLKAHGKTEANARSLIGKWRKQVGRGGDYAVLQAMAAADAEAASEPVAFIEAILREKSNGNGTRQHGRGRPVSDHPLGAFAQFGDEIREADRNGWLKDISRGAN